MSIDNNSKRRDCFYKSIALWTKFLDLTLCMLCQSSFVRSGAHENDYEILFDKYVFLIEFPNRFSLHYSSNFGRFSKFSKIFSFPYKKGFSFTRRLCQLQNGYGLYIIDFSHNFCFLLLSVIPIFIWICNSYFEIPFSFHSSPNQKMKKMFQSQMHSIRRRCVTIDHFGLFVERGIVMTMCDVLVHEPFALMMLWSEPLWRFHKMDRDCSRTNLNHIWYRSEDERYSVDEMGNLKRNSIVTYL